MKNNRSTEFRVWDGYNNQWESKEIFISKNGGIYYFVSPANELVPLEKYHTAQQFTGLLDKNNKKIFDGDVIQYICKHDSRERYIGKIKWNEKGFWSPLISLGEDDPTDMQSEFTFEVIGNIFENPELLK